jgi:hypothetical protein
VPAAFLAFCLALTAQQSLTLDELVAFVKSSKELKQSDREVASFLSKVKLKERLDDRTIETMQGFGIGEKTLQALEALRDRSKQLAKATPVLPEPKGRPKPPPSSEEQAAAISDAREYALGYSKNLPNFLCTQVVRRKVAPPIGGRYDRGNRTGEPNYQTQDTLTLRLSYFEQKEDYKLILVNGSMARQDYNTVGGATSRGEFGSMLKELFEPSTEAHFEFDHWARLNGNLVMSFRYFVEQSHSKYEVEYEHRLHLVPGYSGYVLLDPTTHVVMRITQQAENVPADFPVQDISSRLDYDYQDIGGSQFLLPLATQLTSRVDGYMTQNDAEFTHYKKYSADAAITYDVSPDSIPEEKTKETPVTPPVPPAKKKQ